MSDLDDLVQDFLVESYENLERLDGDLVDLEEDPGNLDIISSVFRTLHTIKGTCGFFGFEKLESITHHGENLLSLLREGKIPLTPVRVTALLETGDAVREILGHLEQSGEEGTTDYSALIEKLQMLQVCDGSTAESQLPVTAAEPAPAPSPDVSSTSDATPAENAATPPAPETPNGTAPTEDPAPATPDPASSTATAPPTATATSPATPEPAKAAKSGPPVASASESSIRVDVQLLDRLMNLVGELVLARNQILQLASSSNDSPYAVTGQQLNLITTELQEGVMKTRMQPIGRAWKKYPRVIRDLSRSLGKKIQLVMEGEETELDRTIVEAIQDPMTHIVRNSVDHGIEGPEARLAAGKPEEGTLLLRSYHEGGQVIIEISDDGAGIDPERIRAKAVEKGIITPEHAERITDRDVIQLIFAPGFSTAAAVTNVSGRGVGMDVVKTNIEKIGGAFDIQSVLGRGTTLRIKIPLTLAIIPALVARCAGERFAIPQVSLLELVRLDGDVKIEHAHGVPVFRLRERLLQVMFLDQELGLRPMRSSADLEDLDTCIMLVLHTESQDFGLIVDEVDDSVEIVVKPLARQLQSIPVFSGSTIMGDGTVSLILDVVGIAQRGGLDRSKTMENETDAGTQNGTAGERCDLLLLQVGHTPLAMELSDVARLEEIEASRLETIGNKTVIQYRGGVMPIVQLGSVLGLEANPSPELLQVVVCNVRGGNVGFQVDRIRDICTVRSHERFPTGNYGIPHSVVVHDRVTALLDLEQVIEVSGVTPCNLTAIEENAAAALEVLA